MDTPAYLSEHASAVTASAFVAELRVAAIVRRVL
jgi:hypothetical protein